MTFLHTSPSPATCSDSFWRRALPRMPYAHHPVGLGLVVDGTKELIEIDPGLDAVLPGPRSRLAVQRIVDVERPPPDHVAEPPAEIGDCLRRAPAPKAHAAVSLRRQKVRRS